MPTQLQRLVISLTHNTVYTSVHLCYLFTCLLAYCLSCLQECKIHEDEGFSYLVPPCVPSYQHGARHKVGTRELFVE